MTDDDLKALAQTVAVNIRLTCADTITNPWEPGGQEEAETAGYIEDALTRVRDASVREARAQAFEEAANWLREMCPTRRAGADHDESICVHSRRADQMLETLAAREREVKP